MIRTLVLMLGLAAGALGAQELPLPASARPTAERVSELARVAIPVDVWNGTTVPLVRVEGAVRRRAWRVAQGAGSPLQLAAPLRAALEAQGFTTVLDCADAACGGYDFRFAVEVLPAPAMAIDLRAFHALSMIRGPRDAPEAAVFVLASRRGGAAFLQIIEVGTAQETVAQPLATVPEGPLAARLDAQGFAVLDDLDFDSGTATLGAGPFAALEALAGVLQATPALRVALVGHTDTVGGLETNIALSRDRARAVRARLIEAYGIAAARLDAEGMGYLAPLTTNATPEGREANRRVEVVILQD
ncbi:OmpA family protein [Sulfitobacter albidus]|uniref:OmpA family protein n=1 Tax=Sulfitobacter albidus TaxID=2829501 RepID=A0A975PLL9_9RHOB|nr:OmpA family protein [Sulfitobacter albidus]QUJ75917.1 OmpA family protein [Sulfitobacter albidus]